MWLGKKMLSILFFFKKKIEILFEYIIYRHDTNIVFSNKRVSEY